MGTFDLNAARALHERDRYAPESCATCRDGQGNGLDWPCDTATALGATGRSEWLDPATRLPGAGILSLPEVRITKLDESGKPLADPVLGFPGYSFEVDMELCPEAAESLAGLPRQAECGDRDPDRGGNRICYLAENHKGAHQALFGYSWELGIPRCLEPSPAEDYPGQCFRRPGHDGPHLTGDANGTGQLDATYTWSTDVQGPEAVKLCGDRGRCVKPLGHGGFHCSNSDTMWPLAGAPESDAEPSVCGIRRQRGPETCVLEQGHDGNHSNRANGSDWVWLPDHLIPGGGKPEAVDVAPTVSDGCGWRLGDEDLVCVRQSGHMGLHYGPKGESWGTGQEVPPDARRCLAVAPGTSKRCKLAADFHGKVAGHVAVDGTRWSEQPEAEDAGTCEKLSPRGQFACTLEPGHAGVHEADLGRWWPENTCEGPGHPGMQCVLEAGHSFHCRTAPDTGDVQRCNNSDNRGGVWCALPDGHDGSHSGLIGWRWMNRGPVTADPESEEVNEEQADPTIVTVTGFGEVDNPFIVDPLQAAVARGEDPCGHGSVQGALCTKKKGHGHPLHSASLTGWWPSQTCRNVKGEQRCVLEQGHGGRHFFHPEDGDLKRCGVRYPAKSPAGLVVRCAVPAGHDGDHRLLDGWAWTG